MSATMELRDYVIADGHLDDFVTAWREGVVPLRQQHGFRIEGAWVIPSERRFVWIVSLDANEAGFSPNLIDWHIRLIEKAIQHRVPLVIGNMSVGTPAPAKTAASIQ